MRVNMDDIKRVVRVFADWSNLIIRVKNNYAYAIRGNIAVRIEIEGKCEYDCAIGISQSYDYKNCEKEFLKIKVFKHHISLENQQIVYRTLSKTVAEDVDEKFGLYCDHEQEYLGEVQSKYLKNANGNILLDFKENRNIRFIEMICNTRETESITIYENIGVSKNTGKKGAIACSSDNFKVIKYSTSKYIKIYICNNKIKMVSGELIILVSENRMNAHKIKESTKELITNITYNNVLLSFNPMLEILMDNIRTIVELGRSKNEIHFQNVEDRNMLIESNIWDCRNNNLFAKANLYGLNIYGNYSVSIQGNNGEAIYKNIAGIRKNSLNECVRVSFYHDYCTISLFELDNDELSVECISLIKINESTQENKLNAGYELPITNQLTEYTLQKIANEL